MTEKETTRTRRREAARETARALREQERQRQRRRRGVLVAAAAAGVLALVVGVGVVVQSSRSSVGEGSDVVPASVTDVGGVLVGDAGAPVAVRIYVDYQCPACRAFETESADYLRALVDDGTASVEHVPVSILDRYSSTRYATRSANAAFCAVDADAASFPAVNEALFAVQPAEGTAGLTDDELAAVLTDAGAPETVRPCVAEGRFSGYVATVTDEASRAGLQGTPTITVDGQQIATPTLADLRAAVDAASGS